MLTTLKTWLDQRTGCGRLLDAILLERIPGGARWRYVWGSTLVFVFLIELITGLLLMTAYSPSDSSAWSSVYYIQYVMDFGWLIRGLHRFGSYAMVVLLGIHMLQVVIAGAHLPPREVSWWLGLVLLLLVLALGLSGNVMPWDQNGYEAIKVETNIAGKMPAVGPWLTKMIIGGPELGNLTLTRLNALHVGILPLLFIIIGAAHLVLANRQGVTAPANAQGEDVFWPKQAFRDMVMCMVVFGILLGLVLWGFAPKVEETDKTDGADATFYQRLGHAGKDGRGAALDAPADIAATDYPARPEWYFLFLFQLRHYFDGPREIIATGIIPAATLGLLFLLPLLGIGRMRPFGRIVGAMVVIVLFGGVIVLTGLSLAKDYGDKELQAQRQKAAELARRSVTLASAGIPQEGARYLLRRDPMTRGKELFKQQCATCHSYKGVAEEGEFKAANLTDFGSKEWVLRVLHEPADKSVFGRTELKGMKRFVEKNKEKRAKMSDEERSKQDQDFEQIAEWLAGHPTENKPPAGFTAFKDQGCVKCHSFKDEGGGTAPDFTGYGSEEWIRLMIVAPDHDKLYGNKRGNTMPAFRFQQAPGGRVPKLEYKDVDADALLAYLSDLDRELIISFMFKSDRILFGGEPVIAAPEK